MMEKICKISSDMVDMRAYLNGEMVREICTVYQLRKFWCSGTEFRRAHNLGQMNRLYDI